MTSVHGHPTFDGKTVTVYGTAGKSMGVLASPQFEEQRGRLFLVGEAVAPSESWVTGARVAVAWDAVCSYVVLDRDEWDRRRVPTKQKSNTRWNPWAAK